MHIRILIMYYFASCCISNLCSLLAINLKRDFNISGLMWLVRADLEIILAYFAWHYLMGSPPILQSYRLNYVWNIRHTYCPCFWRICVHRWKWLTITEEAVTYIEETWHTSTEATTAIRLSDEQRRLSMCCQRCFSIKSKSLNEWALRNPHNWMENAKDTSCAYCGVATHLKTSYLVE